MPHSFPSRRPALALRVLRAGASLAALLVLLAGVPWILSSAGTLPTSMPSGSAIADTLTSRDDGGRVLFTVLTVLAWAGWAWFVLGLAAEIPRRLRPRRHARRRRPLGAPQRLAGFLLGGLLLLPAGTAVAAPAPAVAATAPLQPAATGAPAAPDAVAETSVAAAAPEPAAESGPVHVVGETGETVWDLAVDYLGSGPRAEEIRALNPGLPQTALLPPGLEVRLPSDARPAPLPEPAPLKLPSQPDGAEVQLAAAEHPLTDADEPAARGKDKDRTHTVSAGESLSLIAQQETGDAGDWPRLFEASRHRPQPEGTPPLKDPDVIFPGQKVTIPAADAAPPVPPREHDRHEPSETPGKERDKDDATAPADKPDPAPSHQDKQPGPSASPEQKPTSPAPTAPAPSATARPAENSQSPAFAVTRVAGVLVSLAAAVTLALTIRRILQRRRARPGQLIAMLTQPSPAEAQLAQAAQAPEADGVQRLDLALRTLAHHAAHQDREVPAVRGARITRTCVDVLPVDLTAAPPAPFTNGEGSWWTLGHDAELPAEAAQTHAPYPGLATIGADASGSLLLLNLPYSGVILLNGDREAREEILTSLALELGMSPWAGDVEVVVSGFGDGLNQLLPTARIAHMPSADHAAQDFAERLLEAHQEQDAGLKRAPYLILCAADLDADSAWTIAEALSRTGDLMQVAVIAPAPRHALLFDEGELLDAADRQPQRLQALAADVRLQRLTRQAYEEITAALAVSGQDPDPAEGAWRHVPSEAQTAHAAREASSVHPAPAAHRATGYGSSPPAAPGEAEGPDRALDLDEAAIPVTFGPGTTDDAAAGGLEVFPALLAASTGPSAIPRIATAAPHPPGATSVHEDNEGDTAPGTPHTPTAPSAPPRREQPATAAPAPTGTPHVPAPAPGAQKPEANPGPPSPHIRVLGPVTLTGAAASKHGTREAQLAALLHLRPGRDADALCTDMDPSHPWSPDTLNARLGGLRRSLGNDADGNPYVPRRAVKADPFLLSEAICCDWHTFQQTVETALPRGTAGLGDLERALNQVRGRPFGAQPLPWSEPLQQEMAMRIIGVAHTVATYRLQPGTHHNLTLARRAITTGLEADEFSELLFRDWFRIEAAAGNRRGLNAAIARLEQINRSLDLPLEIETETLIRDLFDSSAS
ncbi:LysM peptidoglycan-binding domain-containing protein [Streptomyces flavofungini]|uniref:LysM peptidoglycan-binding domain-containing protein n=1 Tax=Streptomyces flavofungini TaxID=68200 RepID=A0ABS0XGK7_9ACTN|nr:LysM peptidoglycan-binding domain-containing protein [Streptomyces flavofungini]MBJ3812362.1 LysM peptidoglycan-binding domain-containing protein [Streptomyces flavofungini]GHC88225.1 membrane protein [Streptomyces flavofungini]